MSKNINISARTVGSLLGKSPWENNWEAFMKIVKPPRIKVGNPCSHGIKYEKEAIDMYKIISGNNNVTIDKKMHRHTKHNYITGQVDGIVEFDNGGRAILEVKCPGYEILNTEDFKISSLYWVQVQIYMELFDIDVAHYCEYYRFNDNNCFFRWKEINRDRVWFGSVSTKMDEMVNLIITPSDETYNPCEKILGKKRGNTSLDNNPSKKHKKD